MIVWNMTYIEEDIDIADQDVTVKGTTAAKKDARLAVVNLDIRPIAKAGLFSLEDDGDSLELNDVAMICSLSKSFRHILLQSTCQPISIVDCTFNRTKRLNWTRNTLRSSHLVLVGHIWLPLSHTLLNSIEVAGTTTLSSSHVVSSSASISSPSTKQIIVQSGVGSITMNGASQTLSFDSLLFHLSPSSAVPSFFIVSAEPIPDIV
ncbi:hypothetical protein BLNAU_24058 [Blattamonas nauphoetae]|uniref:Uncharacterized protein n=1 Tax=Blattamonas nauphoetae TaxID=2049346 RepID=A0ABQ9WNG7_9EUKA|nr:hypothetical protein BLNAU_24058 [Blattamonas nauphoetae]